VPKGEKGSTGKFFFSMLALFLKNVSCGSLSSAAGLRFSGVLAAGSLPPFF
jgi:hypothetical protein